MISLIRVKQILFPLLFCAVFLPLVFISQQNSIRMNNGLRSRREPVKLKYKSRFRSHPGNIFRWNLTDLFQNETQSPECCLQCIVIILIISAPENIERRNAIRETWCLPQSYQKDSIKRRWQCVFLIGQTRNSVFMSLLKQEMRKHRDVLLGSYFDTYRNLTLKVFHGFYWADNFCRPDFVLKTDDDCFVNTKLLYLMLSNFTIMKSDLYVGNVYLNVEKRMVVRNTRSKWSLKWTEYAERYYPAYASGLGYIISGDVLSDIVKLSKYYRPLPNEDAFVGILMYHLGVKPIKSQRFSFIASGWTVCNYLYILVIHNITATLQRTLQNKTNLAPHLCKGNTMITTWS